MKPFWRMAFNGQPLNHQHASVEPGNTHRPFDYRSALVIHAPTLSEIPSALVSLARRRQEMQLIVIASEPLRARPPGSDRIQFVFDPAITTAADAWNRGVALARAPWIRFVELNDVPRLTARESLSRRLHKFRSSAAVVESNRTATIAQDALESPFSTRDAIWFRHDVIGQSDVRFEPSVRRSFAQVSVLLSILAVQPDLAISFVSVPVRRSSIATDMEEWRERAAYTEGVRHGYMVPIGRALSKRREIPVWLTQTILEDLVQYFAIDRKAPSPTSILADEQKREFHELAAQVLGYIHDAQITTLDVDEELRFALLAYKNIAPTARPRVRDRRKGKSTILVEYEFADELPRETFRAENKRFEPKCTKIQAIRFFDRTLLHRRMVWVDGYTDETLRVDLDGIEHTLKVATPVPFPRSRRAILLELAAALPFVRQRFSHAWVFIDRWSDADDNAEHLYRWVRANRPEINAWFLLEEHSSDWERLSNEGFRILSSRRIARLLYANSDCVISSHPERLLQAHAIRKQRRSPVPRRVFLQHGTAKDDLSQWFNEGEYDLIATSSPEEHKSIVDDESPYAYTARQVVLAGLARHDRLAARRRESSGDQRATIVMMPTWRASLSRMEQERGSVQGIRSIADTDYIRQWSALLRSPELHEALSRNGKELVFFPHTNLVRYLSLFDLPAYVRTETKTTASFQELFLGASILVTDFSSTAFEMALLRRPVVYYQFDRERFYGGDHNWRPGYFDYERDGFGPIAKTVQDVVEEIEAILDRDGKPTIAYLQRMRAAMPLDDGRACERTFEAIRDLVQ